MTREKSECEHKCLTREFLKENRLSQMEHKNFLSLVWVTKWSLRLDVVEKFFPHCGHSWGFSCWWIVLRCLLRPDLLVNVRKQSVHCRGRSPVWSLTCCLRLYILLNDLLQTLHCGLGLMIKWLTLKVLLSTGTWLQGIDSFNRAWASITWPYVIS